MKRIFFCIVLLINTLVFAEIPVGYYEGLDGLNGSALKAALNDIIDNHIEFSYDDLSDFLLLDADEDPENSNNIILVYTHRSVSKGSGEWNREHVWAKSHGDFGNSAPCGTDAHMLHPCDSNVNSVRGNKDFDNGGSPYYDEGDLAGFYDSDSWEAPDHAKGDIARSIFYMAVRYEGESGELDLEVVDEVNTYPDPEHGKLSTLLQWNIQDPPDAFEIARNDKVYGYQNNRNPFIDHPEYVAYIWGGEVPEDIYPPLVQHVDVISSTELSIAFSESLLVTSAENENNYFISSGIGYPLSANIDESSADNRVFLSINELSYNIPYTITINNIEDLHENVIESDTIVEFMLTDTVTVLDIDFEDGWQGCITYSIASEQDWDRTNSISYAHPSYVLDGSWYAYANNYGADVAANDWLILPQINASRLANLNITFNCWTKYSDVDGYGLDLKYSTNYDSGDPTSANWISIDFSLSAFDDWEVITLSDLSALEGTDFTLAFNYTSSGTSSGETAAWGVDKISLTGSNDNQIISPQNLRISVNTNSVILNWDDVPDATQYHIYISDDPDKDFSLWEKAATVNAVTQWTDTPIASKRFYRVTAQ